LIRVNTKFAVLATLCLLQACTAVEPVEPVEEMIPATASVPVPELTLNLAEQNCNCEIAADAADYTFLEKGFSELVEGDHIEAVQSFQRYQRLEKSAEADWESGIAIAYVSTLPKSPFYDPVEAQKAFSVLKKQKKQQNVKGKNVHERALFMRDALEAFLVMQRHVNDLQTANTTLKQDLKKREEALKRLRELALGQSAKQP
jgi:hypothetical protein